MGIKEFNSDNIKLTPFVDLNGATLTYNYDKQQGNNNFQLKNVNEIFSDELYFTFTDNGVTCKRVFTNKSNEVINLKELGIELSGIVFDSQIEKDYFYSNENPRLLNKFTISVDEERPEKVVDFDGQEMNLRRIGCGGIQPFPAVLVSNYNTEMGIVHGTLSQNVFYHNYEFKHENNYLIMNIFSSFKSIAYREVKENEVLIDEWYLGKTCNADDIEHIFDDYTKILRNRLQTNFGKTNINRDNIIWGSWNDGIYRDVSEDMLIHEANALIKNFPMVRWFQLDDGYAVFNTIAHGLGVTYEGEEGIDKNKFPDGLKSYVDKVKLTGLRPALWIGGLCPMKTKIYKEHPEWFCDFEYLESKPLDVSKKEVREYMVNSATKLLKENGFESLKHDFWTYAFEKSEDLLSDKSMSGYELRSWWLGELRKLLPDDGYMESGCDISMGNPFLAKYFTNYRYGIDIGTGKWDNVRTNFMWGTACFANHTGDLYIANSDAIGMLPGLNDRDAMFYINFVLITRSMLELAGRYTQVSDDDKRLKIVKKAVCNINNGQNVHFVGFDYRKEGFTTPEIMYINTPHFTTERSYVMPLKTVALFNIDEENKKLSLRVKDLKLDEGKYILTDVWSGEQIDFDDKNEFELLPHESRLFAVSIKDKVLIYDADIKLVNVENKDNCISFENCYKNIDGEIYLSVKPTEVLFDGEKIDYTFNEGKLKLSFDKVGKIQIKY